jgi:redox-sensitive bicupin YhaK (pirin superfamily)
VINIRPAAERGVTRISWLDSKHSFSFGNYYDPRNMGFRSLRVINDDLIAPGGKFGRHPHDNMEILTWVLKGSVVHQDSTGAQGEIRPGDAQKMSAGTGIYHSEANGSSTEPLHLLQIWIEPERQGLTPEYQQTHFPAAERTDRLRLIAARDGREGAIVIHQDVSIYDALLTPGARVEQPLNPARYAWIQVATGAVTLNGALLQQGDAAALSGESLLQLEAREPSEVLVFDLG